MTEYLGVTIEWYDKFTFLLLQPETIKKLYKTFKRDVEEKQSRKGNIPAHPGVRIEQTKEEEKTLTKGKQKLYCSGVEILLWLSKHTYLSRCP